MADSDKTAVALNIAENAEELIAEKEKEMLKNNAMRHDHVEVSSQLCGVPGMWIQSFSALTVAGVFLVSQCLTDINAIVDVLCCLSVPLALLGLEIRWSFLPLFMRCGGFRNWCLRVLFLIFLFGVFAKVGVSPRYVICAVGAIQFLVVISRWKSMAGRELIDTLVFSVSASLFISGIAWECGYLTPVLNLQLLRGDVNQDVLMHLSIARMIQGYGVASTGLDGLQYFSYHWGSHAFLAYWSSLLEIPVSLSYSLIYPVLCIPVTLRLLFEVGLRLANLPSGSGTRDGLFSVVSLLLVVWPAAFGAYNGGMPAGIQYAIPYFSESFFMSMIPALCCVGLLHECSSRPGFRWYWSDWLLLLVCLVAAITCKITTGFGLVCWLVCYCFGVGVFLRQFRALAVPLVAMIVAAALLKVMYSGEGLVRWLSGYEILMRTLRLGFVRNVFWYLLPVLPVLVIVSRVRRIADFGGVEVLASSFVPLFVLCPLPTLVLSFSDNEKYFYWTAALLSAPAYVGTASSLLGKRGRGTRLLLGCLVVLSMTAALVNEQMDLISSMRRESRLGDDVHSDRMRLLRCLHEADLSLDAMERRKTCLLLSLDIRQAVFDADSLIDILLPGAVSGLVQINGGPLRGSQLDGMKLFSLGAYDVVDSYSREEAVRRASAFGFETMLVVNRSGSDFAVERIELSGAR